MRRTESDKQPQPNLLIPYSRRSFWRGLLHELAVASGVLRGGQECRLADLDQLPNEQLARLHPRIHPTCRFHIDQGYVWSRWNSGSAVRLFPIERREDLLILNLCDGQHTLDEIGRLVAQEMGWDEARGVAHARELFLSLASRLICIPTEPLTPPE